MKLTLSIPNRAFAFKVLEGIQTGSILELRLRKEGMETLAFTPEDLKEYGLSINQDTGEITWGMGAWETAWEGTVSEGVRNLLVGRIEQMSQTKQFNVALLPLADQLGIEQEKARTTIPKTKKKKR